MKRLAGRVTLRSRARRGLCWLMLSAGALSGANQVAASGAPDATSEADFHRHGVARLQVGIAGKLMDLRLRAPLQSLIGFETAPRTKKQRLAVAEMATQLHQAQALFVPSAEADCVVMHVVLASDALPPDLLRAQGAVAPAARKEAARTRHADLDAMISFECGKPQSLTGLQVRMFDAFPALQRIDVEIVTPRGQSGARLSTNRASLTW